MRSGVMVWCVTWLSTNLSPAASAEMRMTSEESSIGISESGRLHITVLNPAAAMSGMSSGAT
jgi:hypothetical protein